MSNGIECFNRKNKNWIDVDISVDFKVYVCCSYHGNHAKTKKFEHPELDKLHPMWNSLLYHSFDEIMEIWNKYINEETWESETPPPFCFSNCSKNCESYKFWPRNTKDYYDELQRNKTDTF